MTGAKCLVCNSTSPDYGAGLFIQGNFLCDCCEEMIISLKAEDIYYPFVKNSLKKIWQAGSIRPEKRYLS
ncbi:MAG: sigma factor G inhibitor Gin [Bacillota bacterium]|jgi:hypothetical protein|nr:sigma-G inhibitor, Gin [Clostridia bacterium]